MIGQEILGKAFIVLCLLVFTDLICSTLLYAESNSEALNPSEVMYVSTLGNDSWSGLLPEPNEDGTDGPFRTIHYAAINLMPGSTLVIREGIYREAVSIPLHGIPDAPVTIRAAEGERVVISALDEVTGWKLYKDGIYYVDNYEHDSQMILVDGRRSLIQIGDNYFVRQGWVKQIGNNQDDLFAGSFYVDTSKKRLYVHLHAGERADWHLIEASVRDFTFRAGNWVRVEGIDFIGANHTTKTTWPSVTVGSNSIVDNISVTYSDFAGLAVNADNVTICNSRFNWNGGVGMSLAGRGHFVENSEFMYNDWRGVSPGWHVGGMKNAAITDTVIRRNVVAHNDDGIWFDIDCRNITIEENLVYDNNVGIHYEISYGDTSIRNNVLVDNMIGIWSSTSAGVTIENNTVVGGTEGLRLSGSERTDNGNYYLLADNIARRNIVVGQREAYVLLWKDSSSSMRNSSNDHIFFSLQDGAGFRNSWDATPMRFKGWQSLYKQDTDSRIVNPGFRAPARFDFRPDEQWSGYGASPEVLEWVIWTYKR